MICQGSGFDFRIQNRAQIVFKMASKMECFIFHFASKIGPKPSPSHAPRRPEDTPRHVQVAAKKRDQNPENTVGILTMAGAGVEVLCPLVSAMQDLGKILVYLIE